MQNETSAIPPFDERGNLPTGIYKATIDDVVRRFGGSKSLKRSVLSKNLKVFLDVIKHYATAVYIDGSFVTSKLSPGDVDIVVILSNRFRSNNNVLGQLLQFQKNYAKNKLHIFVCFETDLDKEEEMLNWFTTTRRDDNNNQFSKGIISLEIKS